MKKFITLLSCCLFIVVFSAGVRAALPQGIPFSDMALVYDETGLLSHTQIEGLTGQLKELNDNYTVTIAIAIVNNTGSRTAEEFADDFYDYNGYDENGALLLISMNSREWHISTSGNCIDYFNDSTIKMIGEKITPYLSARDYETAFEKFIDEADNSIGSYIEDRNLFNSFGGYIRVFATTLLVGIALALIVVRILAAMMKTVRKQASARSYEKDLQLTGQSDIFLYSHTTRRKIETSSNSGGHGGGSSTHTSSSGRSHGGGGGRF